MSSGRSPIIAKPKLELLLRTKVRSLRNQIVEAAARAPIRVWATLLLIAIIWVGLYFLFLAVFMQFRRTPLEATVAIPLVFNFFFLALLALLSFSNAIIAHGALFAKREAEYLLASPLRPRDVVTLKFVESLALSSWSLILLGLPLMFAMAQLAGDRAVSGYSFYIIFVAFFLVFIPIPGSLGLLLAWVFARFFPRKAVRIATIIGGTGLAIFMVWGLQSLKLGNTAPEIWLRAFLARMSFVEAALFPNNWVTSGIDGALHGKSWDSLLYLCVTLSNSLFLSWLAVNVVSRYFDRAYDRAIAGRDDVYRVAANPAGGVSGKLFFYLPMPLRLIAAKDLRTFFRDPLQWSQLVILFGLTVLYLANMPTLQHYFRETTYSLLIPFLNLCAISFILATFTCRFVFPLISLEGHQLWLIGLVPMKRGRILFAKFSFAMTVTILVTGASMTWAIVMLDIEPIWALIHLATIVSVCYGLCGLAVGLGARLPSFDQTNAARIANGLGGTVNLLASLSLIGVVLIAVGVASWYAEYRSATGIHNARVVGAIVGAILLSLAVGSISLAIGSRHFDRVEA